MIPIHIGIIGFGRAGQARLKALNTFENISLRVATQRPEAFGIFAKKHDIDTHKVDLTNHWQTLILDSKVQAVFICSENERHAEQVRFALEHGKHVCVEFPLCTQHAEAQALYALAAQKQRILHMEAIGTLTTKHQEFKSLVTAKRMSHLVFNFTGSLYRWLLDEVHKQHFIELAFGRLYQCVDLFKNVTVQKARLHKKFSQVEGRSAFESYTLQLSLHAQLETSLSTEITLTEHRQADAKRSSQVQAFSPKGLIELNSKSPTPLFFKDCQHFLALILNQHSSQTLKSDSRFIQNYASQETVLTTFKLIEDIKQVLEYS